MNSPDSPAFYTTTSQGYFPGTVAALSSIRTFHPHAPIHVFGESKKPPTAEQAEYLRAVEGVQYLAAADVPVGRIRDAWQLKAHAASYLAQKYQDVLIHLDSDALLCASIAPLAAEARAQGVPVGGRDGKGPLYRYPEFAHYQTLCGAEGGVEPRRNAHYVSTSVLVLPLPPLREILMLWSQAVDHATFGPATDREKLYPGYGDQGVFNAILFHKGITPHLIDNEQISEHWCHGQAAVTFREGRFWKGEKPQFAFHSVGDIPKFWTAGYRDRVRKNQNLEPVYLYWLYQLFDGPCGFLGVFHPDKIRQLRELFFGPSSPSLLEEYFERRQAPFAARHSELWPVMSRGHKSAHIALA
jgi:hypothetical protein